MARGKWAHTLFSSADQTWHRNVRRAMSGFFTTTTVATFEPLTDSTIEVFLDELETRFGPKDAGGLGKPFEALKWLSYFAFDVMSDMTYSQRHGFVKKGKDVSGIIGWVEKFLDYGFVVRKPALLVFPLARHTHSPGIKLVGGPNALGRQIPST